MIRKVKAKVYTHFSSDLMRSGVFPIAGVGMTDDRNSNFKSSLRYRNGDVLEFS